MVERSHIIIFVAAALLYRYHPAIITFLQDPCTRHLYSRTSKAIVRFYNSSEHRDIDRKQLKIWRTIQEIFEDYISIAFVNVDVSYCPNVTEEFSNASVPSYGVVNNGILLALCNAPENMEQVVNFFLDFAATQYKRLKNLKAFEGVICDLSYPMIRGEALTPETFPLKVNDVQNVVFFRTQDCRTCNQTTGIWNVIYELYKDRLNIYHMNCDSNLMFCAEKGATSFPTFIYNYKQKDQKQYTSHSNDLADLMDFLEGLKNNGDKWIKS